MAFLFFCLFLFYTIFFLKILFIFRERRREGEREGEKYQCVVDSHVAPTWDLAYNPGMCPDWESNWQPFGLQPMLNPLSHTSQGHVLYYLFSWFTQSFCWSPTFSDFLRKGPWKVNFLRPCMTKIFLFLLQAWVSLARH